MSDRPCRVLSHPPLGTSAYVDRWAEALTGAGVQVESLSLRTLAAARTAVVHVHWPEHLVLGGQPSWQFAPRVIRALALLLLMLLQRNVVVWTAHNLRPHSRVRLADQVVFGLFERLLDGVVFTTQAHVELFHDRSPRLRTKRFAKIPLVAMDPRGEVPKPSRKPGEPPCLLQFGALAPYKGQLVVLDAIQNELRAGRCRLVIVGRSHDDDYVERVTQRASELPGVTCIVDYISEADLRKLMLAADAAIGVQVEGVNTGVLPAALPIGLPVIAADTMQAREVRADVGEDWIFLVADLDSRARWSEAIQWASRPRSDVRVSLFDAAENGRLHTEFYDELTSAR